MPTVLPIHAQHRLKSISISILVKGVNDFQNLMACSTPQKVKGKDVNKQFGWDIGWLNSC